MAALMSGPRQWFPRLSGKNVGSVGIHVHGIPVRKRVVVSVGEPVKTSTWTVIPLDWRATFPEQLCPKLAGRIELSPIDKDVSRLTVSGRYQPPLGKVGRRLDETLMKGVAETTVRELAQSIAQRIAISVTAQRTNEALKLARY